MTRSRRLVLFGVLALSAAAVCVRLGIWQLHGLEARRARNAALSLRAAEPAAAVGALRGLDSASIHWRHVRLRGIAQYDKELLLAGRSQGGAPGVQLLTPVRPIDEPFGDTLILVVRGFIYAADARTIDSKAAREGDTLTIDGLVTLFPPRGRGVVRLSQADRAVRLLDRDSLQAIIGAPIEPYLLLVLGDTLVRDVSRPARVPPPAGGDGPHLSYAIQWFLFATVFVVGFVAMAVMDRRRSAAGEMSAR